MPNPAFIAALPEHLRVLREQVEEHAPAYGPSAAQRCVVVMLLGACEIAARQFVALTPDVPAAVPAPQKFRAPLGDRSAVIEEPRVPRRGHDPRLPGKRPHP